MSLRALVSHVASRHLASHHVEASESLIEQVLPAHPMSALIDYLDEARAKDVSEIASDVYQRLAERLTLSDGEAQALNRLRQSVSNMHTWDIALQRNNIFKAADHLKMRLPHAFFASDKSAKDSGTRGRILRSMQDVERTQVDIRSIIDELDDTDADVIEKLVDIESRLEEIGLELRPILRMLRVGSDKTAEVDYNSYKSSVRSDVGAAEDSLGHLKDTLAGMALWVDAHGGNSGEKLQEAIGRLGLMRVQLHEILRLVR